MIRVFASIFDLNGVLCNMPNFHYEALNSALVTYDYKPIELQEHLEKFDGLGTKEKLEMLHILPEDKTDIFNLKQRNTFDIIENMALFDMEKVKMMHWLRDNMVLIGCVTNCIYDTAHAILKKAGLLQYLDVLVTSSDVKQKKPNSEGYVRAMVSLGSYPYETIIIEDSKFGLQAARNTGAIVLEVNNYKQVNIDLLKEFIL